MQYVDYSLEILNLEDKISAHQDNLAKLRETEFELRAQIEMRCAFDPESKNERQFKARLNEALASSSSLKTCFGQILKTERALALCKARKSHLLRMCNAIIGQIIPA